ncbi:MULTISPECIES: UDP-N-acetylglucosamine 2-epimerase [Sporosarcina]|uniref:UDP-N-acetylglucosamine 2-epimerase (Non-hydrolysing) n=1 Tax=Sporosarcina newyorkensis TaxID=759851 RepID=A0A1T4Y1L2_9BACL|nr:MULTISPECIES: UDP-N-acetylglucosamine 2-epimerase [Sporosarcina]MBY0223491.1 UDP-N-acetylglucosamine 2-epimerase (hydrolyzing) [Sporosarcina aquimarina]SKA95679.1 UDP-N-acetylglucosamine 2-epimerase (non-hydrolysing) [Sporosarcina newyorkensis]
MSVNRKKVCVVTGTRAEYGLLYWLMKEIQDDHELDMQLIVTGMHLSPEFGLTYEQIEEDGFVVNEKIEMLLSSDTSVGVIKSIGLATIGFAEALERLQPDMVMVLGDRFEILSAAQSALIHNIPIIHLHGGELTYGAYDDAIRHSVTKMATWHFVSTEIHRKRVIQMGENPDRVWNVGALGIEGILKASLLDKVELYKELSISSTKPFFLITFHPETNGCINGITPLLNVLNNFNEFNLLFTKSNADNGGRKINKLIEDFIAERSNAYLFDSLGQLKYLSAAKHAAAVIGNSSSGLIEVPYLNTPTVNCGERQSGRERPSSVIQAELNEESIYRAIQEAINYSGSYETIFGDGQVSEKIVSEIKSFPKEPIRKEFFDL